MKCKDPKLTDTKVVIGPVRLSYTHLFSKYSGNNGDDEGKYQTAMLIPKSEKKTIKAIEQAIETAHQQAISQRWKGKDAKTWENPLRDGDDKDDELYQDHFYLNAKCNSRPGIVDRSLEPITDEDEVYSGMWAIVSITFFGYDANGKKGVACGLNNVMKWADGDKLGGRSSASSDFADVNTDDDDDDL